MKKNVRDLRKNDKIKHCEENREMVFQELFYVYGYYNVYIEGIENGKLVKWLWHPDTLVEILE